MRNLVLKSVIFVCCTDDSIAIVVAGFAVEETGDGLVHAEGGGDGRRAAGELGLRVRAARGGLQRDPARGRVLRAQHGSVSCRLRDEPAVSDVGPKLVGLRLSAVRHAVI